MDHLNRFSPAPSLLGRFLAASLLTACAIFLTSCANEVAGAPTPLANTHLDGNWNFTTNNSVVNDLSGTLSSVSVDGAAKSTTASGSLTLSGSCIGDTNPPINISGTVTNPHDVTIVVHLTGTGGAGNLVIDVSQPEQTDYLSGSLSITGGPCPVTNASINGVRSPLRYPPN